MKCLVLNGIMLFFSFVSFAQKKSDDQPFEKLNKKVLIRLFDNAAISNFADVKWKPNYGELFSFNVSDDGYCYSELDTVMYYTSAGIKKAVMIIVTNEFGEGGYKNECHACSPVVSIATFYQSKNLWYIDGFQKNFRECGNYANPGKFSIQKLGVDFYCLMHKDELQGNMGEFLGVTDFISLGHYRGNYRSIFSYTYKEVHATSSDKVPYSIITTMKIIPKGKYYDIELSTAKNDKPFGRKEYYRYSENTESFEKKE